MAIGQHWKSGNNTMTLLHDAYTALLDGLTHKTGNEIHWYDEHGNSITVEPVDVEQERYVVRYYRKGGSLDLEENYQQEQLHGKSIVWHLNGNLEWRLCEQYYINGNKVTYEEWEQHNDATA